MCECQESPTKGDHSNQYRTAATRIVTMYTVDVVVDCSHYVSHNAPVEYKRPCICYFHQSGLLRMTHCYINKLVQAVCKGESGALN